MAKVAIEITTNDPSSVDTIDIMSAVEDLGYSVDSVRVESQ